jgi:hypothetical protein
MQTPKIKKQNWHSIWNVEAASSVDTQRSEPQVILDSNKRQLGLCGQPIRSLHRSDKSCQYPFELMKAAVKVFEGSHRKRTTFRATERTFEVTLRLTVSQSVSQSDVLVSSTLVGLATRYYFPSECCGLVSVERPLWREDGFAICSVITQ